MAINQVNTVDEEQKFKFNKNQSDILHTIETNNITVNGVNKIVKKPKKGDIMCITCYKENGVLLEADKQKVVWIDGLSINLTHLSSLLEAVGICVSIKGNKALVLYKTTASKKWAITQRLEIPNSSIMNDCAEHTLKITLNGTVNANPLILTAEDTTSRKAFVDKLNAWFLANSSTCSAELVELDTDLPAVDTSDTKDGDSYRNRIIVNNSYWNATIKIEEIGDGKKALGKHIVPISTARWYYKNNGFANSKPAGCCRAKYYEYYDNQGENPRTSMKSIDSIYPYGDDTVKIDAFTSNEYCQLLRDNFANYDEYIESKLIKCPCNAGGVIAEEPCGKENTYKLADCTFLNNQTGKQEILYPAANYAASIDLNAPKLGKGNWWLPSAAEMVEIMRDVTYNTIFWDTKPDFVNSVIYKLNSTINYGYLNFWPNLDSNYNLWTSSMYYANRDIYYYHGNQGNLNSDIFEHSNRVWPITIYEF